MKLGCKPKRVDPRTFKLSTYLKAEALPTPPESFDWTKPVPQYSMLLNDRIGNCVVAGGMHLVQTWAANAGLPPVTPTDAEAQAVYTAVGGYDPSQTRPDGSNPTDNGLDMLTFLNHWRNTGITVGGQLHKILGFTEVNLKNPAEVKAAGWLFGGLFSAFDMPASAQGQSAWAVGKHFPKGGTAPGSWGGHCAPLASQGTELFKAITWGEVMPVLPPFVADYCSEAYAIISPEMFNALGKSISGFELATMQADQAAL